MKYGPFSCSFVYKIATITHGVPLVSRPNSQQLISQTMELLVHACSSSDHHIRLSASENLKKLIKVCLVVMVSCIYFGVHSNNFCAGTFELCSQFLYYPCVYIVVWVSCFLDICAELNECSLVKAATGFIP